MMVKISIFVHEKLCACMCQSGENSLLAYNVKQAGERFPHNAST